MVVQYLGVKEIASSPATPEKLHVYKSGENKGKTRKLKAKPARQGMLPVSEKTIWTWVRDGQFPKPIKMNGRTLWRLSDIEEWIAIQEQKATIATMEA